MNIGTALQDEATRRGWSHAEAGEALQVSQATFSRWVLGENVPASKHWTPIARFLHLPKEQVVELCAKERSHRGARGVRRATDEVAKLRAEVAEIRRLVLRLLEDRR